MNCIRYRKWIKQAVLKSLDALQQAKLNGHLAECDACRELHDTERRLVEVIDLGLLTNVARVPSPDFAARVRMRLAAEGEWARPREEWFRSRWILAPVAGLVALATLLAVAWPASRHRRPRETVRQMARAHAATMPASMREIPSIATEKASAPLASNSKQERSLHMTAMPKRARTHRPARLKDHAPQFQVLVEPGQWREIVGAYRLAQSGHVDAGALAQASEQDEQLSEMKPIEIKPVVVAELFPEKPTEPTR
jgi:hypothetical protein